MEEVRKGVAVRFGDFEIIPIEKWSRLEFKRGSFGSCYWSKEPLGIQVVSSGGRYALDLEGRRSEYLEDLE